MSDPELRIALTLPGGVTPGAFEAGGVCALVSWVQEANARAPGSVVIDNITGASAGALTALLAARVLLAGDDAVPAFRRAWVTEPTLHALRGTGSNAPLSLRPARLVANAVMSAPSVAPPLPPQETAVNVDIALACLRGFSRPIVHEGLGGAQGAPLQATNYLDWSSHTLAQARSGAGSESDEWASALDSALASASHPLLFPARRLNREAMRQEYERRSYTNLPPAPLRLWYSDGGVVNNEPLLQCLKQVANLDGARKASRLVMLVRSDAQDVLSSDNPAWANAAQPGWIETIVRTFDILATHASAADLLRVEKINARIRWTKSAAATITEFLGADERLHDRLREVLAKIEAEGGALGEANPAGLESRDMPGTAELLEAVLLAAAGLGGKQRVDVAVVTPDPALAISPKGAMLNFLERQGRQNRFASGYHNMLKWIASAPALAQRIPPDRIQSALEVAAGKVRPPRPRGVGGQKSLELSVATRAALGRLSVRVARIGAEELYTARRKSR